MEIPSASRSNKAVLGEGYNVKTEEFAGVCVTGNVQYAGTPESSIRFDRSMSSTEVADSLGFSLGGKARYGLYKGSMSAKFASEASASDYAEVLVYSAQYNFKNARLNYTGLSDVGERAKGSSSDSNFVWDNWERTCGHEYVEQVVLGASLYISIKLEFATKADKQSFNAEFSVGGPMFEAKGALEKASSKFGKKASVTIQAYQLGGDVAQLSQALSGTSNVQVTVGDSVENKNVNALISCSMDNPSACLALLDRAMEYATNEFPTQVKPDYDPTHPAGPAELVYLTSPWDELALYPPPPLLEDSVNVAREDLSFIFEQNLKYRNRVYALKSGRLNLSPSQQQKINEIDIAVSSNLKLLYDAANVCYSQVDKCVLKVDEIKKNLKLINESDLEVIPETIAQWYDIKDLPDTRKSIQRLLDHLAQAVRMEVVNFDSVENKGKTVESVLRSLKVLNLFNTGDSTEVVDISLLAYLDNLEGLSLTNIQVTDLSPLAYLGNLTWLSLTNTQVTDLSPLASLQNLVSLQLDENNSLRDLASLPSLSNLQELNVRGKLVLNVLGSWGRASQLKSISGLSKLTYLTSLDLSHNWIEDVSELSSLSNLQICNLSNNPIKDISPLASLVNLRQLVVANTEIVDFQPLAHLSSLQIQTEQRMEG